AGGGVGRRHDGGIPRGRRRGGRGADVQLQHPEPAQGVDRPDLRGRQDLQVHGGRTGRTGRRQDRLCPGAYGGFHSGDAPTNFIEPYLRYVFGFWGITDVEFITAEGLAVSPEQREASIKSARERIEGPCEALAA